MLDTTKMKTLYAILRRPNSTKAHWMKVGVGFVNNDGSINLKLDAWPLSGDLQLRDYETDEEREARFAALDRSRRTGPDDGLRSNGGFS